MTKEEQLQKDLELQTEAIGYLRERIAELEESLKKLQKSTFNMIDEKNNRIAELEKACEETQELLDKQIEATYRLDKENAELRKQLFSAKPTCNNCGHCDCENYQMQRKSEPCALWISHKDQLSKAKENIQKLTKLLDIAGDYFYEDEYLEAERFLRGC